MLVLSRRVQEEIQVGDEIVVKILQTGRNTVKIGIEAPKRLSVVRGELLPCGEIRGESSSQRLRVVT